jgi:hypothetical protein
MAASCDCAQVELDNIALHTETYLFNAIEFAESVDYLRGIYG